MTELPPRERVRDAALMRALAHPLRAALLDYLGAVGPRTASECGEAVDSSASNCSWHLRQLASFGLVERVDAEDGRERPWRAKHVGLELEDNLDPAALGMAAAMLGQDQQLTQRFLDTREQLEPEWQAAAGFNFYALRVTPSELTELVGQIDALLRPYVAPIRQDAPGDARPVHVGLRAVPRIEADGKPSR
ncbi:ArsR/SmtB family transcription factor [Amycolatopsis sp. NPDC059657]|uniref:ArsR/SmtB family transcription factor n=1 Tax=Amycolatopsis sp. NPDC059657 TaxID=3346899 RepID=UPI00367171F1